MAGTCAMTASICATMAGSIDAGASDPGGGVGEAPATEADGCDVGPGVADAETVAAGLGVAGGVAVGAAVGTAVTGAVGGSDGVGLRVGVVVGLANAMSGDRLGAGEPAGWKSSRYQAVAPVTVAIARSRTSTTTTALGPRRLGGSEPGGGKPDGGREPQAEPYGGGGW